MSGLIETLTASGGPERAGFLNDLVENLWPNICVAGADMTKNIVEPMFASMLPAPLNSLHFEKIDLGQQPLKLGNIDVHKVENGAIKLDLDVDWDSKCDIELNGKMIPKIGIEHVKLRGRLSVMLGPLTNVIPLIGAAQVAFVNAPYLKFEYTDAAHIANVGFIDSNVRKIVQSIMASMVVLPNRFLVKLDANNDWFKTYQHPIGVLRLTVESGSELGQDKEGKSFFKKLVHDEPDCFVKVLVSAEQQWRTKTIQNNRHPEWNETNDFVVSDYEQQVELDVDDDDTASDDDIGVGAITVKKLLLDGGRQELGLSHKEAPIPGKIKLSSRFLGFVPDASSLSSEEPGIHGLLTILVASALGIPGRREELKPSVAVTWGSNKFRTAIKTDIPGSDVQNPSFDQAFRIPLQAGALTGAAPVRIALMDGTTETGAIEVKLEDVLAAPDLVLQKDFAIGGGDGPVVRAAIVLRGTKQLA
ncbi:hypothetical protein QBC37DRAFT_90497 [Rhypophila decipiens]|uniref:C2 domain-containing protein n=1 Tax=Rhypophila decipiens TaxID=261697 RepID=A0AAN7BCZ6_9PEZI|nr:hypothetical protein QBC37DRAFT_90497 [Rhypophila decipiens]